MLKRGIIIAALAAAVWAHAAAVAQAQATPVGVGLSVEPPSVSMGEVFRITLSAAHPRDHHVVFPQLPAQWQNSQGTIFEVRSQIPIPASENADGTLTSSMLIEAALFGIGDHTTPALSVGVRRPDGSVVYKPARPATVTVEPLARREEVADIQPQAQVPVPPLWPWMAGGGVAFAALAVAAGSYWRRKIAPGSILMGRQAKSPREAAMLELDRIESLALPSRGRVTEHYVLLSDCLRAFMHSQHGIRAQEMTTAEIVSEMRATAAPASDVRDAGGVLEESDLVKFAGLTPSASEAADSLAAFRDVIGALAAEADTAGAA